jgi:hypothetical protein
MEGLGGGLAALAFWGFIASTVVGGIWYAIREKQAQHATLQRLIESGKDIDADVIDKIVSGGGKTDRDLRIGAYITMSVAPGLVLLGFVLGRVNDDIFAILSGVAGLVLFVGLGMLAASKFAERSASKNDRPLM